MGNAGSSSGKSPSPKPKASSKPKSKSKRSPKKMRGGQKKEVAVIEQFTKVKGGRKSPKKANKP